MPRTPPTFEPPALYPSDQTTFELKLETITPMFGGSAQTRQVDKDHPVRAASVRGHLRFWWRATAGARFKTPEELFKAEAEIWGSAEKHGAVRVEVETLDAGREVWPVKHEVNYKGDMAIVFGKPETAYALFPFQGETEKDRQSGKRVTKVGKFPISARDGVKFRLKISCVNNCPPEYLPQVKTAVQTWVMFGGIGARTRRGCGSLRVTDGVLPSLTFSDRGAQMLTTLPGSYFLGKPESDPVRAWAEAVGVYRDFRQGDGIARTPRDKQIRGSTPGRSYWPEPDTIRQLRDKFYDGANRDGQYKQHKPQHKVRGFPRADLGLPITFHFKDEGSSRRHDPTDQELRGKGEGKMRFASPIITKAIEVNGQYLPLIMIMDSPHVWEGGEVVLEDKKSRDRTVSLISVNQLQAIQPESPQNGKPIREAFKLFVAARQVSEKDKSLLFEEVKL